MADTIAEVIVKVQKLLALSKSANANEAAAAAAAANKLIDKFRLSQDDVEAEANVVEPIVKDTGFIYESGRITMWKAKLVHILTKHYGVAYYNAPDFSTGRQVSRYQMVGRKSDMDIVRTMYNWLINECERLSKIEAAGNGKVFVASYQEGFVAGIGAQLDKSRQQIRFESTSTAMVKIDSRYEDSTHEMENLVPGLRTTRAVSARRLNPSAFGMGQNRGASFNIGTGGTRRLNG